MPLPLPRRLRLVGGLALTCGAAMLAPAAAQPLAGERQITLHQRDGGAVALGSVTFTPTPDGRSRFVLALRPEAFKDFFLSMKEFKCVESPVEIFCHVPYPYPQPATVGSADFAWLEHSLLFMFKLPAEFGARLWNGVYFQLRRTERGLEGKPQAVDLNRISAPPDAPGVPPYRSALRDDIAPGARFFDRLTIE
ncbi:MAG: hypothetical protein JNL87_05955 [Burkholderiaceae bacterium]|nr:hypothetical protein [Burkholderiaceae bacterium]